MGFFGGTKKSQEESHGTSVEQQCVFLNNPFPVSIPLFRLSLLAFRLGLDSVMPLECPCLLHSAAGRDDGKLLW